MKVEIEVTKETYEFGQGIVEILKSVLVAKRDGWNVGQDLPAILMTAVSQLAAVEGIDKISEEAKNDPAAFGKALMCALADGYAAIEAEKELDPEAA